MAELAEKWFFTPSIGSYGAALQMDVEGKITRLAFATINEMGLSFIKWAPLADNMCAPGGGIIVDGLILFEAAPDHASKLDSMFSVIIPVNGRPRLIK